VRSCTELCRSTRCRRVSSVMAMVPAFPATIVACRACGFT
jgi:hypothetical protein